MSTNLVHFKTVSLNNQLKATQSSSFMSTFIIFECETNLNSNGYEGNKCLEIGRIKSRILLA